MRKPNGYWKDFANLADELFGFIRQYGSSGVMPTYTDLKKAKRYDLANAINKNGGYSVVAQKLNLELTYTTKGYWENFGNLEQELLNFIDSDF